MVILFFLEGLFFGEVDLCGGGVLVVLKFFFSLCCGVSFVV